MTIKFIIKSSSPWSFIIIIIIIYNIYILFRRTIQSFCKFTYRNFFIFKRRLRKVHKPYPAATGPWRVTPLINQPLREEKGWVANHLLPAAPPDPTGINLFHRLGVGSSPTALRACLTAVLLPVILKRLAGRSAGST